MTSMYVEIQQRLVDWSAGKRRLWCRFHSKSCQTGKPQTIAAATATCKNIHQVRIIVFHRGYSIMAAVHTISQHFKQVCLPNHYLYLRPLITVLITCELWSVGHIYQIPTYCSWLLKQSILTCTVREVMWIFVFYVLHTFVVISFLFCCCCHILLTYFTVRCLCMCGLGGLSEAYFVTKWKNLLKMFLCHTEGEVQSHKFSDANNGWTAQKLRSHTIAVVLDL